MMKVTQVMRLLMLPAPGSTTVVVSSGDCEDCQGLQTIAAQVSCFVSLVFCNCICIFVFLYLRRLQTIAAQVRSLKCNFDCSLFSF